MKTTLELPDDLVKEIKILAVNEGKKLKDAVADLLRQGLAAASGESGTVVKADKATLKRRKALTQKFVVGEWGVELAGYEAARKVDRRKAAEHAKAWRD
jgi:plasmid stability protein